ncbi:MAG TPA: nickel-binding protein [bacterium]
MPRYVIERNLPPGFSEADIEDAARRIVAVNSTMDGVRWIRSNLAVDRSKFFDEYEASSPAALLEAARLAEVPCDTITEVREIHPDTYTRHTW